ncbi:MAG TPA: hypothetical protein VFU47_08900, partial [Armatimonadota bacterium]|nr:hypothetical protein [Armatimonadota bacterium]
MKPLRGLLLPAALLLAASAPAQGPPKLVLALASFRDRPLHPRTYFYEHDGVAACRPLGAIEAVTLRVDTHPSLGAGGRLCAYASELENNQSETRLWDLPGKREITDLPGLNTEAAEMEPSLSADGNWVVFSAWNRQGAPAGWNLFLYSLKER